MFSSFKSFFFVLVILFSNSSFAQLGTSQTVLVCLPATNVALQGPCPDGYSQSVVSAYLISSSEASTFESFAQPFDSTNAMMFFSISFFSTISLWAFALGIGHLLSMLK